LTVDYIHPSIRRTGNGAVEAVLHAEVDAAPVEILVPTANGRITLEVAGFDSVEDPAEEVAQAAQGEDEDIAESRGESGQERGVHHFWTSLASKLA